MDKILYIHVGTPKTGSSAIQRFCTANREVLEKNRYSYPILPYRYDHKSITRNGYFLTGPIFKENKKRDLEAEENRFQEGMEIIKTLFQSHKAVVLSDEALWRGTTHRRPQLWQQLNQIGKENGFKVVIIVYLRRQDQYLTSLWSQDVKVGYLKSSVWTWEKWYKKKMKDRVIDYSEKIKEYVDAVGRENVIVRKYDRKVFEGGNIYTDFLRAIGLDMKEDFVVPQAEENLGLKGNANEIRRVINTVPDISDSDHVFFRSVMLGFSGISAKEYPSSVMSETEREKLLAQCEEGNREVARLIYGEDRELFEKDDKELPKWEKDNPYMVDDVIRLVASTAIQLREENRKLEERVHQLEEQVKQMDKGINNSIPRKVKRKIKKIMDKN
jgi:hypothetical protein